MAWTPRRVTTRTNAYGVSRVQRDSYSNTQHDWWAIRKEVFERDNRQCQKIRFGRKCLQPGVDVHHIIPLSRGGRTLKSNLMTVCKDCHDDVHRQKFSRRRG